MGLDAVEGPQANGLKTVGDTIVAPNEAFASLRVVPTWGWALIVAVILLLIAFWLERPAQIHASVGTMQHMFATSPLMANSTDEQRRRAIEQTLHPTLLVTAMSVVSVVATLFVACLINTVVLLIGSAAGRGKGDFLHLWAGSMNIAVPTFALSYLVLGVICMVLGPQHFATSGDMMRAVPGLGMLAPGARGFAGAALTGISIFSLWGFVLNIQLMRVVAEVRNAAAWIAPLIVLLGGAAIAGVMHGLFG